MDQGIIFCRTRLDCDNLEKYFKQQGGGPKAAHDHQFSSICLHSGKKPQERKQNLQSFKVSFYFRTFLIFNFNFRMVLFDSLFVQM